MVTMGIERSVFIEPFTETMGVKKANELFCEAVAEVGLPEAQTYTPEEARAILAQLETKGLLAQIGARLISARLIVQGDIPY